MKISAHKSFSSWAMVFLSLFLFSEIAFSHSKDKTRWDKKYSTEIYLFGKHPVKFLADHSHLLPKGKVLDVAMGEGRNGVYLATKGFDVTGVDISQEGLKKAHELAEANHVKIVTRVTDLESITLEKNAYDVVVCTYYMQRNLFPQMKDALKPGGMIVVETYNMDYLKYNPGFKPQWALKENELLDIFKDFKVLRYESIDDGQFAYSSILAQKP